MSVQRRNANITSTVLLLDEYSLFYQGIRPHHFNIDSILWVWETSKNHNCSCFSWNVSFSCFFVLRFVWLIQGVLIYGIWYIQNCQALVQVPNPLSQQAPNPDSKVRPSLKNPKTQFFGLGWHNNHMGLTLSTASLVFWLISLCHSWSTSRLF